MAHLRRENVISGVRGQRARITPRDPRLPALSSAFSTNGKSWNALAGQIKDDILAGAFKPDATLPTSKELQARYDVSYATLIKALRALIKQDLLVPRGGKFAVPKLAAPRSAGFILFLWVSDKPFLPTHDHDTLLIRMLERDCFRHSIALEKRIVFADSGQVILWRHGDPTPLDTRISGDCLGVVYFASWPGSTNPAVFNWLSRLRVPISIVDWLGGWALPENLRRRTDVQVQASSVESRPGFDMGRYLMSQGHHRIAYFSPYALQWPAIRLKGLVDACALGGSSYQAHGFFQDRITRETDFHPLVQKRQRLTGPVFSSLPGVPAGYAAGRTRLEGQAWIVYANSVYFDVLQPLFEKAFADKSITAWVGCNDAVALMAWSFLRGNKVRIPADISLAGFGNTLEAVQADVTSYDYDYEASVSTILNFILRIRYVKRFRGLLRPEIRGHIVERGSTAKVVR
jgi:hypothetical protein